MSLKERIIGHGGMSSPAEKSHISLPGNDVGLCRLIRNLGMTYQTGRFAVDIA